MTKLLPYAGILLKSAWVTVELSALALVFAVVIGALVGMLATTRAPVFRVLVKLYVELIRSVPLLVQLFFIYYAVPLLTNVNMKPYLAASLALSIWGGAFMVEAVRSGIESVGRGQREAAQSLAMRYPTMMLYVVAPQALRVTVPAAIGITISLIKASSQASIIGFVELLQTAINVRDVIFTISPILAAGVLYFVMCFVLDRAGARVERALHSGGHRGGAFV